MRSTVAYNKTFSRFNDIWMYIDALFFGKDVTQSESDRTTNAKSMKRLFGNFVVIFS